MNKTKFKQFELIGLILLLFIGCKRHRNVDDKVKYPNHNLGLVVEVQNQSHTTIKKVAFYADHPSNSFSTDSIRAGDTLKGFYYMKDNEGEGAYTFEFNRSGKKNEKFERGYYTNGYNLEGGIVIEILTDSVSFYWNRD